MIVMAKGWDSVKDNAEAQAANRLRMQETFLPELRVNEKNTGPFVGRFLEQGNDVNSFYVHPYKEPNPNGGRAFTRNFTCAAQSPWNQECQGCRAGMPRKIRGVYNLIQRGRPVYRKDSEGKTMRDPSGAPYIDGYADTVVIANVGSLTAEELRKADGQYQGLMSRDFVISYSGSSFQSWSLSPAIDQQGNAMATPMSDLDFQLASARYDLDKYMTPPSAQEASQIIQRFGANSGASQQSGPQHPQPAGVPGGQFTAGVDPARMAAAGMNSFGLATGVQPQPAPAAQQAPQQPQPAPVQPQPVAPAYVPPNPLPPIPGQPQQPAQQPVYQVPSVQSAPQQPQQQAWQQPPPNVGVPATAAPPQQQQTQPAPLNPVSPQQSFS